MKNVLIDLVRCGALVEQASDELRVVSFDMRTAELTVRQIDKLQAHLISIRIRIERLAGKKYTALTTDNRQLTTAKPEASR